MAIVERRDWASLETDCLVNIFSRVGLKALIFYMPKVCKSWYTASFDPFCWRLLDLRAHFRPVSICLNASRVMKVLQLALNRSSGSVVRLILPHTYAGDNIQLLEYASQKCPTLEELSLPGLDEEEEKEIPKFICRWKNLKWLDLRVVPSSFKEIFTAINQHCKNFVGLKLGEIGFGLSFEELVSDVTTSLPHLKCLILHEISIMYRIEVIKVMVICKDLERLVFQDINIFDWNGTKPLFSGVTDYRFEPMEGLPIHQALLAPNFFTLDCLGEFYKIDFLLLNPKERKVLKCQGTKY